MREGISSFLGERYVQSDKNKKILYVDSTSFFGHSMSQTLLYDEIEMWCGHPDLHMNQLEENLNTPDDSDFGYFIEVDIKCPDNIKETTKNFPLFPENKKIIHHKYNDHMKKNKKPEN